MLSTEEYHEKQVERLRLALGANFDLLPKECLGCQHPDWGKHVKAFKERKVDLLNTSKYCELRMIFSGEGMCAGRFAVCEEAGVKLYRLKDAADILNTNSKRVWSLFKKHNLPLTRMKRNQALNVPDWAVRYLQHILGKV